MLPKTMSSDTRKSCCPIERGCGWSLHGYKHVPFRGMTRNHTAHKPARYLLGTNIQELETETVKRGVRSSRSELKSEYQRDVGCVIGWDEARDATVSFVECSGGLAGGRTYHGRPMATSNRKVGDE
jgi:hypothetical protein